MALTMDTSKNLNLQQLEFGDKVTSEFALTRLRFQDRTSWHDVGWTVAGYGRAGRNILMPQLQMDGKRNGYTVEVDYSRFLNLDIQEFGLIPAGTTRWYRAPYKVNGVYVGDARRYDGKWRDSGWQQDSVLDHLGRKSFVFACVAIRTASAPLFVHCLKEDLAVI